MFPYVSYSVYTEQFTQWPRNHRTSSYLPCGSPCTNREPWYAACTCKSIRFGSRGTVISRPLCKIQRPATQYTFLKPIPTVRLVELQCDFRRQVQSTVYSTLLIQICFTDNIMSNTLSDISGLRRHQLRSSLFWVVSQRRLGCYRRFGTTYRFYLHWYRCHCSLKSQPLRIGEIRHPAA